jgi:hypothetical protein
MVRYHEVALEGALRHAVTFNGMMDQLKTVPGSAFEVIQLPPLRH